MQICVHLDLCRISGFGLCLRKCWKRTSSSNSCSVGNPSCQAEMFKLRLAKFCAETLEHLKFCFGVFLRDASGTFFLRSPLQQRTSVGIVGPNDAPVFGLSVYPDPWADPKSGSTLGFHNLHHRCTVVLKWWLYFLDPPRGLGKGD